MNKTLKSLLVIILFTGAIRQDKICSHLGFGQANFHHTPTLIEADGRALVANERLIKTDSFINDTIYRWDEQMLDWVVVHDSEDSLFDADSCEVVDYTTAQSVDIHWELLVNIQYRLRYFSEVEAELFAPIFGRNLEALNEKEVIIEGYILPLDGTQESIALSLNPYASCFFCGNASPASVMSMHLEDKGKKYKMDDFKKFKGILYLNVDDPNNFYYILRDAVEI